MTEILSTRPFERRFGDCVRYKPEKVKIAVPYFGTTPFGSIVKFSQHLLSIGCALDIVTGPPNKSNGAMCSDDAKELTRHEEVNLAIRTGQLMHAKLYQFDYPPNRHFAYGARLGFVGSANFSKGGFKSNYEVVAFFGSREDNDRIARQIEYLLSTSEPYIDILARQEHVRRRP